MLLLFFSRSGLCFSMDADACINVFEKLICDEVI
jgi:hypothetical protein